MEPIQEHSQDPQWHPKNLQHQKHHKPNQKHQKKVKKKLKEKKKRRRKVKRRRVKRRKKLTLFHQNSQPQQHQQLLSRWSTNTTINITTIPKREISETTALTRKFMVSPPTTNQFSHSHGEDKKMLIQVTELSTQLTNGLIKKHWPSKMAYNILLIHKVWTTRSLPLVAWTVSTGWPREMVYNTLPIQKVWTMKSPHSVAITVSTGLPKRKISVTKALTRKFTVSPPTTNPCSHNHGEDKKMLIH